jgi:apoptotic chromatin condensation inducer in the nucleus
MSAEPEPAPVEQEPVPAEPELVPAEAVPVPAEPEPDIKEADELPAAQATDEVVAPPPCEPTTEPEEEPEKDPKPVVSEATGIPVLDMDRADEELSDADDDKEEPPSTKRKVEAIVSNDGGKTAGTQPGSDKKRHRADAVVYSPPVARTPKRPVAPVPPPAEEASDEQRVVTPSPRQTSRALRIDNFLRPFTQKQLLELLGETGTIVENGFWMNAIKTHCYVIYESEKQGAASRKALFNITWPKQHGKKLLAEYVGIAEAERAIRGETTPAVAPSPPAPVKQAPVQTERLVVTAQQSQRTVHLTAPRQITPPPAHKKSAPPPPEPMPTLDDLFRKTKAKPPLYWLPLTEAQIEEKKAKVAAAKASASAAPAST